MAKSPLNRVLLNQAPALAADPETAKQDASGRSKLFGEAIDALPPDADPSRTCIVRFQPDILEQLRLGAVLELELPPLEGRYQLLISEVLGSITEGRVLRGRLLEDELCRESTITLGADRAYGTLVAPRGTLEFEAKGGTARVVMTPHRRSPRKHRAWLLPKSGSNQVN